MFYPQNATLSDRQSFEEIMRSLRLFRSNQECTLEQLKDTVDNSGYGLYWLENKYSEKSIRKLCQAMRLYQAIIDIRIELLCDIQEDMHDCRDDCFTKSCSSHRGTTGGAHSYNSAWGRPSSREYGSTWDSPCYGAWGRPSSYEYDSIWDSPYDSDWGWTRFSEWDNIWDRSCSCKKKGHDSNNRKETDFSVDTLASSIVAIECSVTQLLCDVVKGCHNIEEIAEAIRAIATFLVTTTSKMEAALECLRKDKKCKC